MALLVSVFGARPCFPIFTEALSPGLRGECLAELAPAYTSRLGDLRRYAGTTVRFHDWLSKSRGLRIGYELSVAMTDRVRPYVRQLAYDLRAFSAALHDDSEIAAVAVEYAGSGMVVFYRSDESDTVSRESFERALERLRGRMRQRQAVFNRLQRASGSGLTIHQIHSHPEGYSAPHSARDVIGAIQRWREFQDAFGDKVSYESHVLPLEYDGVLLFSFEPAEHRVY